MYYINIKSGHGVETVDEFKTLKEAVAMLAEYQLIMSNAYLSSRCTKAWKRK